MEDDADASSQGPRYVFFDQGQSLTAFYPGAGDPPADCRGLEALAVSALEEARARRPLFPVEHSALMEEDHGVVMKQGEETDAASDASTFRDNEEVEASCSDVDALMEDESVKRKLQLLAEMVGVDADQPAADILAEVVMVLRELEQRKNCCTSFEESLFSPS